MDTGMEMYDEWKFASFYLLVLDGNEWLASRPGCFTPNDTALVPTE